jgi:hypothetical protein
MQRILAASLAFIAACADDSLGNLPPPEEPPPLAEIPAINGPPPEVVSPVAPTCQTGALLGRVCLPGSSDALVGAQVYLWATDCLGNVRQFATSTHSDGQFSLAGIPVGEHILYVAHSTYNGSFTAVSVEGEISVVATSGADAPICIGSTPPRLAVITGMYDSVEDVLDGLSLGFDLYDAREGGGGQSPAYELLTNLDAMMNYDVLFFNCGTMERDFLGSHVVWGTGVDDSSLTFDFDSQIYENLRAFVSHGGNVYASDWAWPIAEALAGPLLDFRGDEDVNGVSVLVGVPKHLNAHVEDGDLAQFLASNWVALDYNLDGWAIVESVTAPARVVVSGDVSAYDLESAAETPIGTRPLLIGVRPFVGGGYLLYTTFHYHAQPTEQMLDVLRYLIFQL